MRRVSFIVRLRIGLIMSMGKIRVARLETFIIVFIRNMSGGKGKKVPRVVLSREILIKLKIKKKGKNRSKNQEKQVRVSTRKLA